MIHISQFYPCSEVNLACELYYICELGKYSYLKYGQMLSLDGVILDKSLKKCPYIWQYFRFAVKSAWVCNVGRLGEGFFPNKDYPIIYDDDNVANYFIVGDVVPYDREDSERRKADNIYNFSTPLKTRATIGIVNDEVWEFSIGGFCSDDFTSNNKLFNGRHGDQAWVSMAAMVAVERQFKKSPSIFNVKIDNRCTMSMTALSYLFLLADSTLCFKDWLNIEINGVGEPDQLQLGYISWYIVGRDRGMCDREYSGVEKFNYLKKLNIRPGDIVLYYERNKGHRLDCIKEIKCCHFAKILSVTSMEVALELINTTSPYFNGKKTFENHSTSSKALYMGVYPYETFNTTKITRQMSDVGVEYMLYKELGVIVPLGEASDVKSIYVTDGKKVDILKVPQNDFVYWMLKDYNYEFNEDRFIQNVLGGVVPLRTRYLNGEELEDFYYERRDV